jgi:death-on-curing protein
MMLEPIFLTVDEIEELHADGLDEHGGQPGVRDRGLLESAVATPQAGFGGEYAHSTLWLMASAYAFHIAQNQPFLDGNKRAGLAAALVFLNLNGHPVRDSVGLYEAMIAISARTLDKAGLADLLESLAK